MGNDPNPLDSSELRRRAERRMAPRPADAEDIAGMSPADMAEMIHELRVHQIELKMQNEELRRIQSELEASRDRYSHLYDFAPVGYLTLNEKGLIEGANLTFATLVGTARASVVGKAISRFIQPEDQDLFYLHRQRLLNSGDCQSLRLRLMKADGSPCYTNFESLMVSDGDRRQFRVVVSDITDQVALEQRLQQAQKMEAINKLRKEKDNRKTAERELKKNEILLKKIFNGILDPLVLVSKRMTIMMMNNAALEYYQVANTRHVLGKKCHQELMGRFDVCEGCNVSSTISSGRHISYERKGVMNSDRVEKVVAYPIFEEDGSVASIIIRVSDITEKKVIEQQLVQKEKLAALGVMVSSIAHEINNPNTFISFNIPILMDYIQEMLPIIGAHASKNPGFQILNMPFPEFHKDINRLLVNMENGTKRISSFISELRNYSHDSRNTSLIWVDLTCAIDSAISICHSTINKFLKTFIKNVPEKLPAIYAQPYAIEQILINFLINAAYAADKEHSWIRLDVVVDSGQQAQVRIAVSDNGHGMDEKTQSKVFDPFFTTKAMEEGTGLGLFVSHSLAERMGGRIKVESEPGEGSKFVLIVPVGNHRRTAKMDA